MADPEEATGNRVTDSVMRHVRPPPELEFAGMTKERFDYWRKRWSSYASLSGLNKRRDETIYEMFSTFLSFDTSQTVDLLALPPEEAKNVDKILDKLSQKLVAAINVFVERYSLAQITQGSLTCDEYLEKLLKCLEKCSYKDCCGTDNDGNAQMTCRDQILLTHFIVGLTDSELRDKLLADNELTLNKAISKSQKFENLKSESSRLCNLQEHEEPSASSCKMNVSKYNKKPSSTKSKPASQCRYCSKVHVLRKENCPARESTCKSCKNKGHWAGAVVCPNTSQTRAVFVHNVQDSHDTRKNFLFENNVACDALVDSGSGANTIGLSHYQKF